MYRSSVYLLLARTVCLVAIAAVCVTAGGGGKHKYYPQPCSYYNPAFPPCPYYSPQPGPSSSSAYAFISSQADLSAAKTLIDELGLQQTLSGQFAGTLFVPNNNALDSYVRSFRANVTFNTDAGKQFLQLYFGKLLNYHILPNSVGYNQIPSGQLSTAYVSINGDPHKVTYSGNLQLLDEQQQTVGIVGSSTAVAGGGVVHIVDKVLQPNDIFPSITAALTSPTGNQFSTLQQALRKIDAGIDNMNIVNYLEAIPGTMAVPNNQAFSGVDISGIDAETLLQIVTYHFCAFTRAWRLLYTPFEAGRRDGKNPCLTIYSRSFQIPYGLAWSYTSPQAMAVSYASGSYPDSLITAEAPIVTADVTLPTHSLHVVSELIVPPANVTQAVSAQASSSSTAKRLATLQLIRALRASVKAAASVGRRSSGGAEDDNDDGAPSITRGGTKGGTAGGTPRNRPNTLASLVVKGSGSTTNQNQNGNTNQNQNGNTNQNQNDEHDATKNGGLGSTTGNQQKPPNSNHGNIPLDPTKLPTSRAGSRRSRAGSKSAQQQQQQQSNAASASSAGTTPDTSSAAAVPSSDTPVGAAVGSLLVPRP